MLKNFKYGGGGLAAAVAAIKAVTDAMPDAGALNDLATILGHVDTEIASILANTGVIDNVLTPTAGVHFWVDQLAGIDTAAGTTPAAPVLTITHALTLCTSGRYDTIHVMANSPSAPPVTETFPIVVNKSGVTIIGEHGKGLLSDSGIASTAANVACFEINAHYVTIQDMYLGCAGGNTLTGVIDGHASVAYWGFTLRNCMVGIQGSSKYGIAGKSGIGPYLLVEDCVFGRSNTSLFTTAAIAIVDNATGGIIRRNSIAATPIAISIAGTVVDMRILNNQIACQSDTVGTGITVADGVGNGCFFDGNSANFGIAGMANNPYRDLHNDDDNTWGLNYAGGIAVMPATA